MRIFLHEIKNTEIIGKYPELIDYLEDLTDESSNFYNFDESSVEGFRDFIINTIDSLYNLYGKDHYTKAEYLEMLMKLCKQLKEYTNNSNKSFIIEYN